MAVEGKWKGCAQLVMLIYIYAPQERGAKKKLWDELVILRLSSTALWCVFGDFNGVRKLTERKGRAFNGVRKLTRDCYGC